MARIYKQLQANFKIQTATKFNINNKRTKHQMLVELMDLPSIKIIKRIYMIMIILTIEMVRTKFIKRYRDNKRPSRTSWLINNNRFVGINNLKTQGLSLYVIMIIKNHLGKILIRTYVVVRFYFVGVRVGLNSNRIFVSFLKNYDQIFYILSIRINTLFLLLWIADQY